ncbi:MAG: hypothetical protein KF916_06235 [Microbacteriaceae bacterium]|nr:hypothetical protein [Microbacteriaceae bacterium]
MGGAWSFRRNFGISIEKQVSYGGGAVSQEFENGWLVYHPSFGIHRLDRDFGEYYFGDLAGVTGALGWPKGSTNVVAGGKSQPFQYGVLKQDSAGVFTAQIVYPTSGVIGASFNALGGASGVMGAPVAFQVSYGGGAVSQEFENGWLVYHPSFGIHRLDRDFGEYYFGDLAGVTGALGWPKGSTNVVAGGKSQPFQYGV